MKIVRDKLNPSLLTASKQQVCIILDGGRRSSTHMQLFA